MKNIFKTLVISLVSVFTLTGCTTTLGYTFSVETGDDVTITLDTTDEHTLTKTVPFEIGLNGTTLTTGIFISASQYDDYVSAVETEPTAVKVDEGEKGDIEYVFYTVNSAEYNYVINIKGSKTGVLLANNVSADSAREVFDKLTITLAE